MLSTGKQQLTQDLEQIEMMVGELASSRDRDIFFRPTSYAGLPAVTLGNYLMHENRLLALRHTALDAAAQNGLDVVVAHFDRVLYYNIEAFKQKIGQELEARLRQWREYVQQLAGEEIRASCYEAAVENRVIIEGIFQKLYILADEPDPHISEEMEQLDSQLRQHWRPGKFNWPAEWQSAYPQSIYWWLYGQPQSKVKVRVNRGERNPYTPQPRQRSSVGRSLVTEAV